MLGGVHYKPPTPLCAPSLSVLQLVFLDAMGFVSTPCDFAIYLLIFA